MSEVSVLSQEYKTASSLSQRLNVGAMAVKRARLGLPGSEDISSEGIECLQRDLAAIVDALLVLLAPSPVRSQPGPDEVGVIPGSLIAHLRSVWQGDLAYRLEDLDQLSAHLRSGAGAVTDSDLECLDEVASAADAQTASVFRRLMRT